MTRQPEFFGGEMSGKTVKESPGMSPGIRDPMAICTFGLMANINCCTDWLGFTFTVNCRQVRLTIATVFGTTTALRICGMQASARTNRTGHCRQTTQAGLLGLFTAKNMDLGEQELRPTTSITTLGRLNRLMRQLPQESKHKQSYTRGKHETRFS
jgi:hypothetical protein